MQTVINTPKRSAHLIPQSVKTPITFSWIIFFVYLVITIIFYFISQPEVPIFYSVATKSEQLAPKLFLFVFPLISLFITVIHFFIARLLQKFSEVLLKLFVGTTVGLQILLGFALFRIILSII